MKDSKWGRKCIFMNCASRNGNPQQIPLRQLPFANEAKPHSHCRGLWAWIWNRSFKWDTAQNALQREWGNFPFANWNGICWGLPLQLVQLMKIHFLPHLESFMWERKFEKKFFKKSPIQPPNGVLLIFKLPFPNGSYRNGVCRALWA